MEKEIRGCRLKIAHRSEREALRAAKKFRGQPGAELLTVYSCQFCGMWHIGHRRANVDEMGRV